MTALYLDAVEAPVQVDLDGPALRVRRNGVADGRFPLRRVTRVVARGPVSFAGESLVAVFAAGIPLAFLDARGDRLGTCLPATPQREVTVFLLEDAAQAGIVHAILDTWRRVEERRHVLATVCSLALVVPDLRRSTVERHVLVRLQRVGRDLPVELLAHRTAALIDAAVSTWLVRHGLGWSWQGGHDPAVDLRRDLAAALEVALWPELVTLVRRLQAVPATRASERKAQRRLVSWFEARWPRLEAEAEAALARLRRTLREGLV